MPNDNENHHLYETNNALFRLLYTFLEKASKKQIPNTFHDSRHHTFFFDWETGIREIELSSGHKKRNGLLFRRHLLLSTSSLFFLLCVRCITSDPYFSTAASDSRNNDYSRAMLKFTVCSLLAERFGQLVLPDYCTSESVLSLAMRRITMIEITSMVRLAWI